MLKREPQSLLYVNFPGHGRCSQTYRTSICGCHQIPPGARVAPSPSLSLSEKLCSLTFGYEREDPRPPTIRYVCANGHVVTVRLGSPASLQCPGCVLGGNSSRRRLCIDQLKVVAAQRGGSLVSKEYVNARTPLLWRCAQGHEWQATADNVRKKNSWCPTCAKAKRTLTLDDMRELARSMGGECLSTDYLGEHSKLRWKCAMGHVFDLTPNNIKRKPEGKRKPSWCKICRKMGITVPFPT